MSADPFGLYVHWPFCKSKCPYCDFNSHVSAHLDQEAWAQAYEREIERCFADIGPKPLSSLFFGGGTPSLMPPETCARILSRAEKTFGFQDHIEITLEANPTSVERRTFANLKAAGINRLSLGVQSLDPAALSFLGRAHSVEDAKQALKEAQKTFERFSFDLIYARPDQTLSDWQDELDEALAYGPRHLSLYQLTIEPGTDFFKQKIPACDEDLGADLFELTQERMTQAGLPAYEISNHAALGEESRHNLIYWQGDPYLGIGPGAHSRLNLAGQSYAVHQIYKPDLWLAAVQSRQSGEQKRKKLSAPERASEIIMMGLRLNEGIDKARFQNLTGLNLLDCLAADAYARFKDLSILIETPTHLKASDAGRVCLNILLKELIP